MKTKDITMMGIFTALCAICAWINIPFIIPFTLQTFAVFLACLVLGGKRAAISLSVYLLLGAVGVPVFSGFGGGVGKLIGPTGGFLVGFPVLCLIYGLVVYAVKNKKIAKILGLILGLVVLYLFGTVWFILGYTGSDDMNFTLAAMKCVVPFILPDLLKMAVALGISKRIAVDRSTKM